MIEIFCRLLLVFLLAFMIGKIASALKIPSVLGFLIAGMIFGPHAINILNQDILDAPFISKHHITFRMLYVNDAGK